MITPLLRPDNRPGKVCASLATILVTVSLLGACGSSPTLSGPSPPVPSASALVSTFTRWDATTWRPPVAVVPRVMSAAEMDRARATVLADALEGNELPAETPLPKLVRWVLPEESGYVFAECMTKEGIHLVGEPNGSSRYVGKNSSEWQKAKKTRLAVVQCVARYSSDPRVDPPRTPSTLEAMWFYYRDYGIPCLRERGFEPDSPLPPLADYAASQGDWTFYPVGENPDRRLRVDDFRVCPEVPWKVLLNP